MSKSRRKTGKGCKWREEEIEYIKTIVKGRLYSEISDMMNKKFGEKYRKYDRVIVKSFCVRRKINSGYDKNKNLEKRQGKQKIGTVIKNKDGYMVVKVKNGDRKEYHKNWIRKHKLIWEEYHGIKVPENHNIIFANGDKNDFSIENLVCVNRSVHCFLTAHKLRFNDIELTKTAINMAKLDLKLKQMENKNE